MRSRRSDSVIQGQKDNQEGLEYRKEQDSQEKRHPLILKHPNRAMLCIYIQILKPHLNRTNYPRTQSIHTKNPDTNDERTNYSIYIHTLKVST